MRYNDNKEQEFLVKTIDKKTITVKGKLIKKPNSPKPPAWFAVFEKKLMRDLKKLIKDLTNKKNLIKKLSKD